MFQVTQDDVWATYLGRLTVGDLLCAFDDQHLSFDNVWAKAKTKLPYYFQCLLVIFLCLASLLQNEALMIASVP